MAGGRHLPERVIDQVDFRPTRDATGGFVTPAQFGPLTVSEVNAISFPEV
jgi:hypothetical protein